MKKQELLDLAGKGYIKIGNGEIKVEMKKVLDSDFIDITQKAINEYTTDHEFNGGFVEYITDEGCEPLEENIEKVYEKMLKQVEICRREPLVLTSIKNSDYFKGKNKKTYIKHNEKDHFEICTICNGEADFAINVPILLDGVLYLPVWSWWLGKGCYLIKEA